MLMLTTFAAALALAASSKQLHAIEASAQIDESGKIVALEWSHPEQVDAKLSAYIKPLAMAVAFEPAKKNGVPAQTEVALNVIVESSAAGAENSQASVRFVTLEKAAPSMSNEHRPRVVYPTRLAASGTSGYVVLMATIGADGYPIERSIQLDGDTRREDAYKVKDFFRAAKRQLVKQKFERLEKVAGVVVPVQLRVPYTFCSGDCEAIEAKVAEVRAQQVAIPTPESSVELASIKPAPAKGLEGS